LASQLAEEQARTKQLTAERDVLRRVKDRNEESQALVAAKDQQIAAVMKYDYQSL
jgi:hypothetical protein